MTLDKIYVSSRYCIVFSVVMLKILLFTVIKVSAVTGVDNNSEIKKKHSLETVFTSLVHSQQIITYNLRTE